MKKIKKDVAEYRYYEVPAGMPLLALQGIQWERIYGRDVDCLHFHNLLEIGYCFDGTGELTILERDYRFSGDMLTLVPRRMPHTTTSDPGVTAKWEWIFVNLESFLGQCFPGNALMRQRISRRINSGAWVLRGEEAPELAVRIRQLLEVMRHKEEFYQEEARGLLLAFLIDIARRSSERVWEEALLEHCGCEEGCCNCSGVRLSAAIEYIQENYAEDFRIQELAERCHLSETHFRKLFRENMRMAPGEYISRVRIRRACELLLGEDRPVYMIAAQVGYTNLSNFNRAFRRYTGMTPQALKRYPERVELSEFSLNELEIIKKEGW